MYGPCLIQERQNGLKYREIAAKYNIPIGTVKSRINRWKEKQERLALERKELDVFKDVS